MITTILTAIVLFIGSSSEHRLVVDTDKKGFNELKPVHLDIDGDGRVDAIQPRTFVRRGWISDEHGKRHRGIEHWIAFDLVPGPTQKRRTIFEYRYGDEQADYWVWALIPAGDLDRNGQVDLVFYSGDDNTDETVILLQQGSVFRPCPTGSILSEYNFDSSYNITSLESYDVDTRTTTPARIVARWNGAKGRFEGTSLYWINDERLALRAKPSNAAKLILWLSRDDVVINLEGDRKPASQANWIEVETTFGRGWVERRGLVTTSQLATP